MFLISQLRAQADRHLHTSKAQWALLFFSPSHPLKKKPKNPQKKFAGPTKKPGEVDVLLSSQFLHCCISSSLQESPGHLWWIKRQKGIMLIAVSFRASTHPSWDNVQISLLPSLSSLALHQGILQAQGAAGEETEGHQVSDCSC